MSATFHPLRTLSVAGLAAAFVAIVGAPGARADLAGACASELSSYCSTVTPGDGRIAACMFAHADKISDGCFAAIEDQLLQIDFVLARLRYAVETCAPDIQARCGDAAAGGGRILGCLIDNRASLSAECGAIVDTAAEGLATPQ